MINYFSGFTALSRNLKSDIRNFPVIKVALVSDAATQFLKTGIKGIGIERGFNIDLFEADFNQVERQLLDLNSELFQYNPEFIIIFQSAQKLLNKYNAISEVNKSNLAIKRIEFLESACKNLNSKVIILNYPEIDDSIFGSYHSKVQHSFLYQINLFLVFQ